MNQLTVGVIEKNRNPYWDMVNAGWTDAAGLLDLGLRIDAPPSEDVDAQLQLMREQLDSGIDALAFVGTDPAAMTPLVTEAGRRGIPVVAFDLDAPNSGRLMFVGMETPLEAGHRAGAQIAALVGRAPVIVQTGSDRAPGAVGKKRGFLEVMERSGIPVIEIENDHEDVAAAVALASQALEQHPDARGIFGGYGYHPVAQAAAVRATGRQGVSIVGFDMLPETVELIAAGEVASSIWIREYEFGYQSAVALSSFLRAGVSESLQLFGMSAESPEGNVRIPTPVTYTKENIQEFIDWSRAHSIHQRTTATAV
ncbi:MAG TPA: substrate-binding domain-containing protein [Pseudolysinimonas sp.]|jgi:ribose transport system substrate-binding protein